MKTFKRNLHFLSFFTTYKVPQSRDISYECDILCRHQFYHMTWKFINFYEKYTLEIIFFTLTFHFWQRIYMWLHHFERLFWLFLNPSDLLFILLFFVFFNSFDFWNSCGLNLGDISFDCFWLRMVKIVGECVLNLLLYISPERKSRGIF